MKSGERVGGGEMRYFISYDKKMVFRVYRYAGEYDTIFIDRFDDGWIGINRLFIEELDQQIPVLRCLLLIGDRFFKGVSK